MADAASLDARAGPRPGRGPGPAPGPSGAGDRTRRWARAAAPRPAGIRQDAARTDRAGLLPPLDDAAALAARSLRQRPARGRSRACTGGRHSEPRTTRSPMPRWSAAGRACRPERSAWRTTASCSSTSCPSSIATCSRRCASRWRRDASRSRASGRATMFPARFQLVAAMNPCPCGFAGMTDRDCGSPRPRCSGSPDRSCRRSRRARIYRGDQLEARRERRRPADAGDRDTPSSSGWRSASSTSRSNSGSSSRNRTPWSARRDLARAKARPAADHRRVRDRVVRARGTGGRRRRPVTALPGRRRSRSSPPAPPRRRAAAAAPGSSARAASCRSRADRSAAGRARPRARSRAPDAPRAGHGPRPGPGPASRHGEAAIGRSAARRRSDAPHELDPRRHDDRARRDRGLRTSSTASARRLDADDLDPLDEARLATAAAAHDDAPDPAPGERRDHRQHPRDRPHLAASDSSPRAPPAARRVGPAPSRGGCRRRSRGRATRRPCAGRPGQG